MQVRRGCGDGKTQQYWLSYFISVHLPGSSIRSLQSISA